MSTCKYCETNPLVSEGCPASHPEGYLCTREEGHEGDHVACGVSDHPIVIWSNDEEDD